MSKAPSSCSSASTLIALASQVSGHAGSLIIKPSTLAVLLPFAFKLDGTVDPDLMEGVIVQSVHSAFFSFTNLELMNRFFLQSIVLENLSFGFLKPNIPDVKLKMVLYDEAASLHQVARMEKSARNTTSF